MPSAKGLRGTVHSSQAHRKVRLLRLVLTGSPDFRFEGRVNRGGGGLVSEGVVKTSQEIGREIRRRPYYASGSGIA